MFSSYSGIQYNHRVLAALEIPDARAIVELDGVFSARGLGRAGSGEKDKSQHRAAIARNQRHQHAR